MDISRRAICGFTLDWVRRQKVDLVEIRWPSGAVDTLKDLDVKRLYVIEEGGKILKTMEMGETKK